MSITLGKIVYLLAPIVLAGVLCWRFPRCRRVRYRSLLVYPVVMSLLIWGALSFVAFIAMAKVPAREVAIILWFTIGWRLLWELWSRTIGCWGQRRVRWARLRRRHGKHVPALVRLIPVGRAALTALIFAPAFLSCVVTHRCKLTDGQDPQSLFDMSFESVSIPTADGLMLDAWFVPEPGATRTIVVCHGAGANKGNFVLFLPPLTRHGYNVVFFDFRAHGSSGGRRTTYGIRERTDVVAVVDWLKRERPAQSERIVGLGSSQGAMALALAAAEEPRIDAIVLDSPFISPRELAHHHARRVPVFGPLLADILLAEMSAQTGTNFFTASAERAVARLGDRPVMVIHGDKDIGMPASHARRLYDAAAGPREIWFGPGPHSNIITTVPGEYGERMFEFLDAHLGCTTSGAD